VTTTPLERLRAAAAGSKPLVPVAASLGFVIDALAEGEMTARMPEPPDPTLRGPGPVLALVDMVLSASVSSALATPHAISTLTLHWSGARPLPAGGPLISTGSVIHLDRDSALGAGRLVDGAGELIATVSFRCALVPQPEHGPASDGRPAGVRPERGVAGLHLTGGPTTWRALGVPWLGNTAGGVQGGIVAAVAAHAMDEVIARARPHLAGAAADLDVTYLRPVPADGSAFTVEAEPLRTGMRLAAATARVLDGAGRLAVVASAAHWRGGSGAG
jgi:acyl-coenzyme A thioesterase PaaI-like protein